MAFYLNGTQVPEVATCGFSPSNETAATMTLATLPGSYQELNNVTIAVTTADPVAVDTVLLLDDLTHCNF